MADPFLSELFAHKAWCNRQMIAALKAAPADVDRMQWAVVLLTFEHTHIVDEIFRGHLSGRPHGLEGSVGRRVPDLDVLADAMAETDAWYQDFVAKASPEALATVVDFAFTDGDAGRMTKGEMLAHVITHGASHRGAVGKMLEGLGVRGGSDMVTTFVRETAGRRVDG